MKRFFIKLTLLAAVANLLAGCTEKYPSPDHFVGVITNGFTRASYTQEGIVLKGKWNAGDRIAVKGASGATAYLTAQSGAAQSDFAPEGSADLPQGPYQAFYPAEIASGILPEVQKHSSEGPVYAPLFALSETKHLEFSPLCGLLEVKMSSDIGDLTLSGIKLTADRPISGSFTVDENYRVKATGSNSISLDFCGTCPLANTSFWFSIPEGRYSGLKIEIETEDGGTGTFTLSEGVEINIIREEITACNMKVTNLSYDVTYGEAYLPNGLNFNRFIKCAARPEGEWTTIIAANADSLITSVTFATEDSRTSNLRIDDGGEAPVYVLYDEATGAVTVTTPAQKYIMHEYCAYMFRNLYSLEKIDFGNMEAPEIVNMIYMFYNCEKLKSLDLSFMNTEETLRMEYVFANCKALETLDVSSFKTGKVTNLGYTFFHCESLKELDLSSFVTPSLTSATYFAAYCNSLEKLDMSNFSLENVRAASFNYGLHALASLRELRVGGKFIASDGERPSSMFVNSTTVQANRPGSKGGLTIYTVQKTADWLAKTNLRWVHSGNKNQQPIDVTFKDMNNGNDLTVTWAAN
ncbi:MAG: BspA family leucine-rich repeat surface protein [Bacteroidales bacterium]|nr:BspA family leucine-rich repeat surface protein [Bacteroidales bacterium]